MARTMKNYNGVDYIADKDFDYTTAIGEAVSHGDYDYAASLEKSRNAKIDGEGLSYAKTYKYQNGTSPVYKSKYGGKIENTLSSIINRKPFSYDYTKDDSYKALEKAYIQNGKLAMQDTLGDAAALTGGRASTAAISASQQAYNRYMTELATNIPALEQAAYGRYMDEEASLYNQLGLYQQLDNTDYSTWNDSWERDHRLSREAIEDSRYDEEIKYRDKRDTIEDGRYDDQITYGREQDTISRLMEIASSTGDYSILRDSPELAEKYGFTEAVVAALNKAHAEGVSEKKIALAFARAQYMAQYGDFSYFKEAGFTDEQIAKMEKYWEKGEIREDALLAAQFGDYSLLRKMGLNPQVQTNNKPGSASTTGATSQPASASSASGSETDISSFDDNFFDDKIVVADGDGYKGNVDDTNEASTSGASADVAEDNEVDYTLDDVADEEKSSSAVNDTVVIPGIFGNYGGTTVSIDYDPKDLTPWEFEPVSGKSSDNVQGDGSLRKGEPKTGEDDVVEDPVLPEAAVEGMEIRDVLGAVLENEGFEAAKEALDEAKQTGVIDPARYRSLLTWLMIQDNK